MTGVKTFSTSRHRESDLDAIRDEVLDKVRMWESDMSPFFSAYREYAQNWRIRPVNEQGRKKRGLANSKSGETHRATETLATLFFRMLTASDPFFQCVGKGLNPYGMPLSESEIYATEAVLVEQIRKLKFKPELLRSLTSLSLFGSAFYELAWISMLNPDGATYFEGTKLLPRPLVTTGFDTSVYDPNDSDYVFTVDYLTKWRLKQLADSDPEAWDRYKLEEEIGEGDYKTGNSKHVTNVYNEVLTRKQRAGYASSDQSKHELISYYGRLDAKNPVISEYWESNGFEGDPKNYDFSIKILNGKSIVQISHAPYGNWRSKFKSAHYKQFELEPLAYGAGHLGYRTQKDLDISIGRTQDLLSIASYGIYKLGRYAGLKPSQMLFRPHQVLEMDDINQLDLLKVDINTVAMALNFQGMLREEIRSNTGATANLQAQITKATATESALTQNEAIRSASVHAEIISETLIRDFLEQAHVNNLYLLDSPIWVAISGEPAPRQISKNELPSNVGFETKTTTDKDFRPERIQKILEGLQMITSIRNIVPQSVNAAVPMFEEYFRALGMNPRLLKQPRPAIDEMTEVLKRNMGQGGTQVGNEIQGELAQLEDGNPVTPSVSTPVGEVMTSPNQGTGELTAI